MSRLIWAFFQHILTSRITSLTSQSTMGKAEKKRLMMILHWKREISFAISAPIFSLVMLIFNCMSIHNSVKAHGRLMPRTIVTRAWDGTSMANIHLLNDKFGSWGVCYMPEWHCRGSIMLCWCTLHSLITPGYHQIPFNTSTPFGNCLRCLLIYIQFYFIFP